ncbi:solute carrier family 25 member 45 isoform X2 [Rhineura floridana]|uniref:solute carrier family 25 member 45 isoform X2 n=1 Tax=Rhineura floridana TaxID=261503 RepID=UPI002AC82086|nr:solute carrier family 25 member 45 isoform X2 [Rhineura floridana]
MSSAEFAAGWLSGAAGLALGHPIDTVKVLGFFKGMSFPLLSVAIVNSIMFGAYSNALLFLCNTHHRNRSSNPPSYTHVFVAGCFSGLVQAVVLAPVDLVKVRLQNQTHPFGQHRVLPGKVQPRYKGPVHCAARVLREEGMPGMFSGALALVLRDTPTLGMYFLTYAGLCRRWTMEGQEPGPATVLVAGGCAGTVSWALATPMDVVKARLQMDGVKQVRYQGILDCILTSAQQEGPRVFLRGLALNSLRAFPVNAITLLSYETLLKVLC